MVLLIILMMLFGNGTVSAMDWSLKDLAADAVIKNWGISQILSLSPEIIRVIPPDIQQNSLIPKFIAPVYQFFAQELLLNNTTEKNGSGVLACNGRVPNKYTETEITLLPNQNIVDVTYSNDIQRAFIQVSNSTPDNPGSALFYIFNPLQDKYQLLLYYPQVLHSAISRDGRVIALHKYIENTHNIELRSLQRDTNTYELI